MADSNRARPQGGPGSREPSPAVSAASGFDPSRLPKFQPDNYECKPRHLSKHHRQMLRSFVDPLFERIKNMSRKDRQLLISACLKVSPINCWWAEHGIARILFETALFDETLAEVEARRDSDGSGEAMETGTGSTEGDSAAIAPKGQPNA